MSETGTDHAKIQMRLNDGTEVVLEGSADFVMRAFDRIRTQDALNQAAQNVSTQSPVPELDAPETEVGMPAALPSRPCYIVSCEDKVRSVYALSRDDVRKSPLLAALGATEGKRVYSDDPRVIRALKGKARTLWRELEPEALAEVRALRAAQA